MDSTSGGPFDDSTGLHLSFRFDTVLFPSLTISSWSTFLTAACVTCCICLCERAINFLLKSRYIPARQSSEPSVWKTTLWRTGLYAISTTLQLLYMLIAMTLHVGLIIIIVGTLSICQMCVEYQESCRIIQGGRLRSGSGYSPISAHLDDDDHHHPQHTSSSSSSFFPVTSSYAHRINSDADLEMAESRSPSTVWDREMSSRDKTRKIMTGSDTLTATSFSSTHRPRSSQRPSAQSINSNGNYQTSPIIHRRQSSMVSNTDTVTTTTTTKALRPTYHHRSGSSLQNFGAGPGRRGSPIDTNGSVGARRPLFRIGGTSGEEESGTTTTSDSD